MQPRCQKAASQPKVLSAPLEKRLLYHIACFNHLNFQNQKPAPKPRLNLFVRFGSTTYPALLTRSCIISKRAKSCSQRGLPSSYRLFQTNISLCIETLLARASSYPSSLPSTESLPTRSIIIKRADRFSNQKLDTTDFSRLSSHTEKDASKCA
jgi:hypothetical protein